MLLGPNNYMLSRRALAIVRSVLGQVAPESLYCDWIRKQALSAASGQVWRPVKLPSQIRPKHTLYWHVN